ncbi:MAG: acyl-CoA desaturase [Phycisphaerales bacterium]
MTSESPGHTSGQPRGLSQRTNTTSSHDDVNIHQDEVNVDAPPEVHQPTSAPITLLHRIINGFAVVVPFVGLIVAIVLLWGVAFNWIWLALLGGMYLLTALGITVGYHRYFTHRSFQTSRFMTAVLAVLGSMAFEGPVLQWVAVHRRHHHHSDDHEDPHSPHAHGSGFWQVIRGMWHAHIGWLFRSDPRGLARYVADLRRDRLIIWMSRLFPVWALVGLLLPAAVGGLLTSSWMGVLLGFIWGGLVRIFLVHHVTWSINSVCHIWGSRPFRSHDESRNNVLFGIIALGEGWHNNHHAFPTSARHGLHWWQIDVTFMVIRAMAWLRLVHNVKTPTPERIDAKRNTA